MVCILCICNFSCSLRLKERIYFDICSASFIHITTVVYFDQRTGVPHTVRWLKSFFDTKTTFIELKKRREATHGLENYAGLCFCFKILVYVTWVIYPLTQPQVANQQKKTFSIFFCLKTQKITKKHVIKGGLTAFRCYS